MNNQSNVIQLPVAHSIVPVKEQRGEHSNLLLAREAIERRRKRLAGEVVGDGRERGSAEPVAGVSPMPELPTEPSRVIQPRTAEELSVQDGVVYGGGKKSLSTRALMARIGI